MCKDHVPIYLRRAGPRNDAGRGRRHGAETLPAGRSGGARARLVAALGCTLGIAPHLAAAITGPAAVLHASALAIQIVKNLGVACLL